jgi:hypothetical protein
MLALPTRVIGDCPLTVCGEKVMGEGQGEGCVPGGIVDSAPFEAWASSPRPSKGGEGGRPNSWWW